MLKYVEDENIGYSPLALATVLGLCRSASNDETSQEIKTALSFPQNPKQIESVIQSVYPMLSKGKNFHFLAANKIYLEKNYAIRKDIKKVSEEIYNIEIEHLDFKNTNQRCININEWVKTATESKIDSLIGPKDLDPSSKSVIICAIYFKVNWWKFVQKDAAYKKNFKPISTKPFEVEFMEKTGIYNYFESPELKATFVEMPIEQKLLDLVIILPKDPDGLRILENRITDVFNPQNFQQGRVTIAVPKLMFDYKSDLKKVLQHLGIKKAFTSDADMNGFIAERGVLFLNHVIHKTIFHFAEDTESTAIKATSFAKRVQANSLNFTADHPFIFYVKAKDIIVFAGRVTNPS